jgi:PAS domain S-box-containing protein
VARKPSKKTSAPSLLPSAAESREELRGRLARTYAFGVAFFATVLGYSAYQLTPGEALGVPPEVRVHAATAFGTAVFAATILLGLLAFRRRYAELERVRNLQAQLTIYRVGETLERLDGEEELIRCALDVIAEGTGLAHWAIYRRDDRTKDFKLTATRGLPAGAAPELQPDPIGPDATSPASRAAWLLETIVSREPGSTPDYLFATATEGLGSDPIVVSVPLTDREEAVGVLQCFVPRRRGFDPDQLALVRWTAAQLAVGLKRLRMERRDRMLASYLHSSAELVLVLDAAGVVTDMNDAAERALAAAPGSLKGRSVSEFAAEEATGRPFARGDAIREGGAERVALLLRRGDGRTFPCEATVATIAHPETGESARLVVGRDVTERREREAALRQYTEELRRLNGQLQQANARLEAAQQAQQQFLANTSHELRTPLNGVIGFSTLIEQGSTESPEETRGFAKTIRESAEHLLAVLNDILDLAKMEAGAIELRLAAGDARGAIRAAADSVRSVAGGKGLALRVELPEGELPVVHDESRMRQVMLNVVGNAVKFTDQGEVAIRAWRDADRDEVCVVVTDTGVGIPRERQSKLFSKFAQMDGSYSRRRPGTGLGLAITKGLVERMGGAIEVESEGTNRGTHVRLTFPAAATAAEPGPAPERGGARQGRDA